MCYLLVVERLVSLNELEGYTGGRSIFLDRATHPRKVDGVNLDQKQSPRSPRYEVGLEIHYYRCFGWYGHSDL